LIGAEGEKPTIRTQINPLKFFFIPVFIKVPYCTKFPVDKYLGSSGRLIFKETEKIKPGE
jgi:hypothetical protein